MQNPRAQRSTLYSHYPLSWFYSEFSIQIFGRTAKAVVEPGAKKDNCHCNQLGLFCFKTRLIFTLLEGCGILLVLFERPITKDAWQLDFMQETICICWLYSSPLSLSNRKTASTTEFFFFFKSFAYIWLPILQIILQQIIICCLFVLYLKHGVRRKKQMDSRGEIQLLLLVKAELYQQKDKQYLWEEFMNLWHRFNKAQVSNIFLEQLYKAHANSSTCSLVSKPTHPLPPALGREYFSE